jgi:hypothetical protein
MTARCTPTTPSARLNTRTARSKRELMDALQRWELLSLSAYTKSSGTTVEARHPKGALQSVCHVPPRLHSRPAQP